MINRPFEVYDFREDVRNVVVTPEIRGRFLRMEPGEVGPFHSHDVGQEIFLVLEGRAEFEIAGATRLVEPGQLCFARAGELHEVRVVGEEPMTLFLAVTPHLEPTHTLWEDGRKLPPVYGYWTPAGLAETNMPTRPLPDLAARQEAALRALLEAASAQQEDLGPARAALGRALDAEDFVAVKGAVDQMAEGMARSAERFAVLMAAWNELALGAGVMLGHGSAATTAGIARGDGTGQ